MSESAEAIRKVVAEQVVPELRSLGRSNFRSRLLRVEAHIPDLDPLHWLQAQDNPAKLYWSDREQAFAVAGIGCASEIFGHGAIDLDALFGELKKDLRYSFPNLRYYGGFRFDPDGAVDDRWAAYGSYRFVVPKIEVGRKGNRNYFAVNLVADPSSGAPEGVDELVQHINALDFPEEELDVPFPCPLSRSDAPDREGWHELVNQAMCAVDDGQLEKLVLGRETFYEFEGAVPTVELLRRLVRNTIFSFHFFFQFGSGTAFLGASPERLYKRQNTYLQSEALAGTRTRGLSPEEDAALGAELLGNEKEIREHQYVLRHVRNVFDQYCRAVRGGDHLELLILRHCQHLLSRLEGMLTVSEADPALFRAMHPSPAVGGVPSEQAMEFLRTQEPFDRGWYGAPVGWVGYDATEFAVAIRSGLITDNTLSLYSGAGLVRGSNATEEWDEIENKLSNFVNIIEHDQSLMGSPGVRR